MLRNIEKVLLINKRYSKKLFKKTQVPFFSLLIVFLFFIQLVSMDVLTRKAKSPKIQVVNTLLLLLVISSVFGDKSVL